MTDIRIAGSIGGIKFDSWVPSCHCKHIGRFKFGSLVWDRHMYTCEQDILADFNCMAVAPADRQTAKFNSLPNFLAIQYYILHVYQE